MITFFKLFSVMFLVFIALDLLWLGVIAKSYYRENLAMFITKDFNWYAAILFYLIFIGGMVYFVFISGPAGLSYVQVLTRAAIFGLVTYATYDLTNLATLREWPLWLSVVDISWGIALSSLVSSAGFLVYRAQ